MLCLIMLPIVNDGVLAYTVAVATVTAGATGWRRLTLTLTTAGGGRDDEGSRFRSFFMEINLCWPVSVGQSLLAREQKWVQKFL